MSCTALRSFDGAKAKLECSFFDKAPHAPLRVVSSNDGNYFPLNLVLQLAAKTGHCASCSVIDSKWLLTCGAHAATIGVGHNSDCHMDFSQGMPRWHQGQHHPQRLGKGTPLVGTPEECLSAVKRNPIQRHCRLPEKKVRKNKFFIQHCAIVGCRRYYCIT